MELAYGEGSIKLDLESSYFDKVLVPENNRGSRGLQDPVKALEESIDEPVDGISLEEKIRAKMPSKISLVVEDKSRRNPEYPEFLSFLINMINKVSRSKIYLVIAYGTHATHSEADNKRLYGEKNLSRVTVIHHDSRNSDELQTIGELASGLELKINKYVAESDFVITLGNVEPHAFAGFTGGRKAVLPGISSYEIIQANHSKVCLENVGPGILVDNPVHKEMSEAAAVCGVDFSIQIVRNNKGMISGIFAGGMESAFNEAVFFCKEINSVEIDSPGDVVFVGCGGYPKDKSLYFSQRAITTAVKAVNPGGLVIVFGHFGEGVGNQLYYEWLKKPLSTLLSLNPEKIELGVHSAYLTALNLNQAELVFWSDMEKSLADELGLKLIKDIDELTAYIDKKFNRGYRAYLIPKGSEIIIDS